MSDVLTMANGRSIKIKYTRTGGTGEIVCGGGPICLQGEPTQPTHDELTEQERETLNKLFNLVGVPCVLHPSDDWVDAVETVREYVYCQESDD